MKLATYSNEGFSRGASSLTEIFWLLISGILVESWLPGSGWRVRLLRLFGAKIGNGVTIKPRVRVKFPWRLSVGNDTWIGESVWIDNLVNVIIGNNVCISQGVYLCTGSHNWKKQSFDLIVKPIVVKDHVWVGAMARVAPGVHIGEGAVVEMAAMVSGMLPEWRVVSSRRHTRQTSRTERLRDLER